MLKPLWCYKCKEWTTQYNLLKMKHYKCDSMVGPYKIGGKNEITKLD